METNLPFIMLDGENGDAPLYRQIYEAIRRAILCGECSSERQLPATRLLAKQLGVSRMTVINAYEQLFAEGYLESRSGAGTFVAAQLPDNLLNAPRVENRRTQTPQDEPRQIKFSEYGKNLVREGAAILRNHAAIPRIPFQHGQTAIEKFPFDVWTRLADKWLYTSQREIFGYGEPAGFYPLREAITVHLESARGVKCSPEQVIITGGAQQAFDLIGRILLQPDDEVWFENPGHTGAKHLFQSFGAKIVPVPVDQDGLKAAAAMRENGLARLVYVTPSHQFPLGVTMCLPRRLELLEWAKQAQAWIVEDDYDSEFRYAGRPLASLQGLDQTERVIYIGTFSKTIFPALRLGCLVVPPDLIEVFTAARALSGAHSPIIDQAVLADFITEGHFARHIRRMRRLYEERQEILVAEVKKQIGERLEVEKTLSGMHLIGWLADGFDDRIVSAEAAQIGIKAAPVSAYSLTETKRGGLILGYTGFDERQIKDGVKKLAAVLR